MTPAPTVLATLRRPRALTTEVLAGVVTTLALVPEVIAFSVIAGVDPKVMGTGPIPASRKALVMAGWSINDLVLVYAF